MASKKKKSGPKKKRSAKQIAATKRMIAANKAKHGGAKRKTKKGTKRHGATTSKGYPKILLEKHARKLDAVLRREGMGHVSLSKEKRHYT